MKNGTNLQKFCKLLGLRKAKRHEYSDLGFVLKDTPHIKVDGALRIWCGDQSRRIVISVSVDGKDIASGAIQNSDPQFMELLRAMHDPRLFRNINNYGYEYIGDIARWENLDVCWSLTTYGRILMS